MTAAVAAILALTITAALHAAEAEKPAGWTPALMMKVKRISGVQVSPDGKQVVFTVRHAVMDGAKASLIERCSKVAPFTLSGKVTHTNNPPSGCDQRTPAGMWAFNAASIASRLTR